MRPENFLLLLLLVLVALVYACGNPRREVVHGGGDGLDLGPSVDDEYEHLVDDETLDQMVGAGL